jgi:hypothetical protein
MPVKPAHPKADDGPITHGKGLDSLAGFIIQNWAPSTRFGIWGKHVGTLSAPKVSLAHFLDDSLQAGWTIDGGGAVITIDPPQDPFVTIRVESENKNWTPESKYNPKHWLWKVVPLQSAIGHLESGMTLSLPEVVASYLRSLREGRLKDAWPASPAPEPIPGADIMGGQRPSAEPAAPGAS